MADATLQPSIVKIDFQKKEHSDVLFALISRKKAAQAAMSHRLDRWKQVEDTYQFYVTPTNTDTRLKQARDDGLPSYTTVHVPYSYAVMLTAHTYLSSVFLSRSPILQLQGRNSDAQNAERKMEAVLDWQLTAGGSIPALYFWLHDALKYGQGILWSYWDKDVVAVPESFTGPKTFLGVPIPGSEKTYTRINQFMRWQGLRLFNSRPQDSYSDPSVTLANLQQGEFVGRTVRVPFNVLRRRQMAGEYYNVDEVRGGTELGIRSNFQTSANVELPGTDSPIYMQDADPYSDLQKPRYVDLDEIIIELIPSEWPGLPNRDNLEKWVFTVASERVILCCQPLGLLHNQYPVDVIEYEFEPYNIAKRGMLEMLEPLNQTLDWLINTHFYSVRRALNDEIIYDPSILMRTDMERPGPGKLIRVRPDAFGKNISQAYAQLQTVDITQNHLKDVMLVVDMMNRLSGVNDNVMGVLSTNRKTATEVRTSSSFAVNRLKVLCEFISNMGFTPLTQKFVSATQQLLEGQVWVRLLGMQDVMESPTMIQVAKEDLGGFYDFVPVDGTLPVDRQAQSTMIGQMISQFAQIPQFAQGFDFVKLAAYLLELNGIKNVQQFKVQVMPPGASPPPGAVPVPGGPPAPGGPPNAMNNMGVQPPALPPGGPNG